MTDVVQFVFVTMAACAALAFILRPLLQRPQPGSPPPCAGCPSSRARKPVPVSEIQPLRLIRRS